MSFEVPKFEIEPIESEEANEEVEIDFGKVHDQVESFLLENEGEISPESKEQIEMVDEEAGAIEGVFSRVKEEKKWGWMRKTAATVCLGFSIMAAAPVVSQAKEVTLDDIIKIKKKGGVWGVEIDAWKEIKKRAEKRKRERKMKQRREERESERKWREKRYELRNKEIKKDVKKKYEKAYKKSIERYEKARKKK